MSMLNADVLTVVLKQGFQVDDQQNEEAGLTDTVAADTTDAVDTSPQASTDEWCPIDKILQMRKRNGQTQYLVKWEGSDQNSWVKRADVTDFAVQAFLKERKHNKKRKVRFQ